MDHAVTPPQSGFSRASRLAGRPLDGFSPQFLLALFNIKSVNLTELTQGFAGPAQVASRYKRLQGFFRAFTLDYDVLAR